MIFSPIMGSLVYEHFKEDDIGKPIGDKFAFNKTCDVFAMLTLAYTVVYLLFNVIPGIVHENKMRKRRLQVQYIDEND